MKIMDKRIKQGGYGEITHIEWNFTRKEERVILSLDNGYVIEIYERELDKIRPRKVGVEK